jgi:hypothetical protein
MFSHALPGAAPLLNFQPRPDDPYVMEQHASASSDPSGRHIFPPERPTRRASAIRPVTAEEFWRMTARHGAMAHPDALGPPTPRPADPSLGPDPAAPGRPWSFGSTGRRWRFSLRRRSADQAWYDDPA